MYEEDEYAVAAPLAFCYCSIGSSVVMFGLLDFICLVSSNLGQAMHLELTRKAADVLEENENLKKACRLVSFPLSLIYYLLVIARAIYFSHLDQQILMNSVRS